LTTWASSGLPCASGFLIAVIWDEDSYKGTRLNLLYQGVGGLSPYLSRSYHRVDGHPQPLLRAVRRVIYIAARGMPDHEDIQIMRRWPMPLKIARGPRTEDQYPLCAIKPGEFLSYHLQRAPGEEQQLGQRLDKAITHISPNHSRSPEIATTQQTRIG
jgi:hypothetical protein